MKLSLLFPIFCFFTVFSQQETVRTILPDQRLGMNPAYSGIQDSFAISTSYRDQWQVTKGRPVVGNINASLRLKKLHGGIHVGGILHKVGFNTETAFYLGYAYHLHFKKSSLSFGLNTWLHQFKLDPTWVPPTNYPDPLLPGKSTDYLFTSGLGINYHTHSGNIGFSVSRLPIYRRTTKNSQFTLQSMIYLVGDKKFSLNESFSFWLRGSVNTDLKKITSLATVLLSYKDKFWFGPDITLHKGGIQGVLIGGKIKNFTLEGSLQRSRINQNSYIFELGTKFNIK